MSHHIASVSAHIAATVALPSFRVSWTTTSCSRCSDANQGASHTTGEFVAQDRPKRNQNRGVQRILRPHDTPSQGYFTHSKLQASKSRDENPKLTSSQQVSSRSCARLKIPRGPPRHAQIDLLQASSLGENSLLKSDGVPAAISYRVDM